MGEQTRIMVVDDHALVRESICERLRREPDLVVVGTAASAEEAVEVALAASPDIVVMDIDMPGMVCFDGARRIVAARPNVRILLLSAYVHDVYVEQAIQAKLAGYVTKRDTPEVLLQAIREIAAGGWFFSDDVQARIVVDDKGVRPAGGTTSRGARLTLRELEILQYLARGMSKKEIAAAAGIAVKTVDRHSTNLMKKLDIHDRVELARYAIREGLVRA